MNEAFSRNANRGAPQSDQIGTNLHAYHPSSLSETGMDDTGITFVPKKYQDGSPAHQQVHEFDAEGADTCILSASQALDRKLSEDQCLVDKTLENRVPAQQSETPKGSGSRQAGTPITETELMRRRRLLDSHIFK